MIEYASDLKSKNKLCMNSLRFLDPGDFLAIVWEFYIKTKKQTYSSTQILDNGRMGFWRGVL